MGTLMQLRSRDRLITIVSIALLAGGLLALTFPVFLGAYDSYGIQIHCGSGYYSQSLQAEAADQEAGRQPAPDGAPADVGSATSYVEQCQSALAHRRAWAVLAAGLGALILTSEVMAWVRGRAVEPRPAASPGTWSEAPDDYMHEAASLDRRGRPRRKRPAGTML